jgi:(p)ppGpp synthase/HD superfamily hydrolase
MADLQRALEIACEAHRGQRDKAGGLYVLHPLRVMFRCQGELARTVAVLHDVLEDTAWTADDLRREGFGDDVLRPLNAVTQRDGEDKAAAIERAAADPVAREVKLADLEDNMDITRLREVSDRDARRLSRYIRQWHRLREASTCSTSDSTASTTTRTSRPSCGT